MIVANGVAYYGSGTYDGKLYAFDAVTGVLKWSYQVAGNEIYSTPAVVNGVVYVGSWNDLYAFHLPGMS